MKSWRAQFLIAATCLILGLMLVPQFRSQRSTDLANQSLNYQATYISSLYRANVDLRDQLAELQREVDAYKQTNSAGSSNLEDLVREVKRLRIANGEVDITGPGVRMVITDTVDARHIQDVVNELRSSGVEGMAVGDVRLLARSVVSSDADGHILVDNQQVNPPYVITAIGDPDTIEAAVNRKGGLVELLRATEKLQIGIEKITLDDRAAWIKMPKTAIEQQWRFAQPAAAQ
jgi:uncharacterized protein YlxW (UPF0749 family)